MQMKIFNKSEKNQIINTEELEKIKLIFAIMNATTQKKVFKRIN